MSIRLGINTGFAVNRFSEPEEWTRIVGKELGIRYVQLTADLINPSLPDSIIRLQIERIKNASKEYGIEIRSTFTGAFTRLNHLAHPDSDIRKYWVEWFKRFVDISTELGARSIGSHFGIFTAKDNHDKNRRKERRRDNIACWHEIGKYASQKGLDFISWEPMSISREQGETISECRHLQDEVNRNAPIPFKICLDVDHGDLCSTNPDDTNPYAWLEHFVLESPQIHLKQSSNNKGGHWPFTEEHNKVGRIKADRILRILEKSCVDDVDLILELSFREREPEDSNVVEVLKESVHYWRRFVCE